MAIRKILIAALAVPLLAAAPKPAGQALTCSSPVKPGESAAAIKARFGSQARAMTVNGPEGTEFKALVLWPNDKRRRIEVLFGDEDSRMRKAVALRVQEDLSRWRSGGVGIGSTLQEVVRANGRSVNVSGFGWDYGGAVDTRDGKLQHLPGGCSLGLVMSESAGAPDGVFGDGVNLNSNDAKLKAARPHVVQMTLFWPKAR